MHSLKAAYIDRADGHPTMRCSCGYMCGAQSWEVVGRAMDRHVHLYAFRAPDVTLNETLTETIPVEI